MDLGFPVSPMTMMIMTYAAMETLDWRHGQNAWNVSRFLEGRTEAVEAKVYVPGVGLGAEGGELGDAAEEAARKTRGDQGGFVEKTREKARERFERLG